MSVEQAHNGIHGRLGGDMGTVQWSAFDPIFYLHHGFVEKVFEEYQLCQEVHFDSSWINTLPQTTAFFDSTFQCFNNPALNENPMTAQQTVSSILENRNNKCYVFEGLQCSRTSCSRSPRAVTRSLVFNMKHVKISGKFVFDICIPSDACTDGCCYLDTKNINYFGMGSDLTPMDENAVYPYNVDITDLLKGYEGYNNNDEWLASVPVQTRTRSFTDVTTEELDLPLDLIDPTPYNLVRRREENTILINWDQLPESIIFSSANAKIEFFNGDERSQTVWELVNEDGTERTDIACDQSQGRHKQFF